MAIKTITQKVYFDTNTLIYLIEKTPVYIDKVTRIISELDELECRAFTSELTLAECLVKPFAEDDVRSQEIYISSIKTSAFLTVKPVSKKILIEASRLRSIYKNKLPDSIHLATALENGCDIFVSNDKKIKAGDGINALIIDDYL
jgi:predicted nucleic acid-binding protein